MPVVPWHCITQRSLGHRNHTIYFIVLLIRFLELKKKKKGHFLCDMETAIANVPIIPRFRRRKKRRWN